jgi:hypothetical protein
VIRFWPKEFEMVRRQFIAGSIVGLSLLSPSRPALAQTPEPAPVPDPTPATAPVAVAPLDQTSPRGTMKLYFTAGAHSDGDALGSLLLASNFPEEHMIAALVAARNCDRDLTAALMKKYPDNWKVDPRVEAEKQLPAVYNTIDQSDQEISGNIATLQAPGAKSPLTFRLVAGKWFIPLASIIGSPPPEELEQRSHQIMIQANTMRSAIDDVNAGKYATQDAATSDIKKRMMEAALADHQAATQPATQP